MRRTARDKQVHGQDSACALVVLRMTNEWPAHNRARADRDHNFWRSHRVIGFLEREFHVLRYRASNKQSVRVTGRGDILDAEATEVPPDCAEHIDVRFTSSPTTGPHHASTAPPAR